MKQCTSVLLFAAAILVVMAAIVANFGVDACDTNPCWATCQAKLTIYFNSAYCDGDKCVCVSRQP
ncbi:hypothetical protein C0J52_00758 [Blattella germanica]|nr:hypothetical protein C0J52_00758 [Blattella germanica]